MPQIINTNVPSLNAQRNLDTSQTQLAVSLQRLSSGLRINSARDDAAGLAIAQRFTAQIRGLNQAARNANDGISLSQTAEGALAEVGNNLQRIRELAVQSANATNSSTDRVALQAEAAQLIAEIDRVATTTKFNGVALLDGTFTSQQFQVGADSGQTISISSIASSRTTALGASYSASRTSTTVTSTALASGDLILNGVTIGASLAASDTKSSTGNAASAIAKAVAINAASGTGVTATANTNTVTGIAATAFTSPGDDITAGDLTINGVSVGAVTAGGSASAQATAIINAINSVSAATGVIASNATSTTVTLSAVDGRNITVGQSGTATTARTGLTAATTYGTITLSSTSTTGITVAGATPANAGLTAGTTAASQTGTAVSALNISSVSGANTAITSIDAALATIASTRGDLGAYQNRFASTVANLTTTSENLSASRSRIQDADFASETAALTRGQILQQAGVAILAQANSLPQNVLSLLR